MIALLHHLDACAPCRAGRPQPDSRSRASSSPLTRPYQPALPLTPDEIADAAAECVAAGAAIVDIFRQGYEPVLMEIVDRACIIYGGQVLFAGSPEALVADPNVRRLYLGESFAM